jgi:hypothetical protein
MEPTVKGRPAVVLYFEVTMPGLAKKVTVQMVVTPTQHIQREILLQSDALILVDQVLKIELADLSDPTSEITAVTAYGPTQSEDHRYIPLPLPK